MKSFKSFNIQLLRKTIGQNSSDPPILPPNILLKSEKMKAILDQFIAPIGKCDNFVWKYYGNFVHSSLKDVIGIEQAKLLGPLVKQFISNLKSFGIPFKLREFLEYLEGEYAKEGTVYLHGSLADWVEDDRVEPYGGEVQDIDIITTGFDLSDKLNRFLILKLNDSIERLIGNFEESTKAKVKTVIQEFIRVHLPQLFFNNTNPIINRSGRQFATLFTHLNRVGKGHSCQLGIIDLKDRKSFVEDVLYGKAASVRIPLHSQCDRPGALLPAEYFSDPIFQKFPDEYFHDRPEEVRRLSWVVNKEILRGKRLSDFMDLQVFLNAVKELSVSLHSGGVEKCKQWLKDQFGNHFLNHYAGRSNAKKLFAWDLFLYVQRFQRFDENKQWLPVVESAIVELLSRYTKVKVDNCVALATKLGDRPVPIKMGPVDSEFIFREYLELFDRLPNKPDVLFSFTWQVMQGLTMLETLRSKPKEFEITQGKLSYFSSEKRQIKSGEYLYSRRKMLENSPSKQRLQNILAMKRCVDDLLKPGDENPLENVTLKVMKAYYKTHPRFEIHFRFVFSKQPEKISKKLARELLDDPETNNGLRVFPRLYFIVFLAAYGVAGEGAGVDDLVFALDSGPRKHSNYVALLSATGTRGYPQIGNRLDVVQKLSDSNVVSKHQISQLIVDLEIPDDRLPDTLLMRQQDYWNYCAEKFPRQAALVLEEGLIRNLVNLRLAKKLCSIFCEKNQAVTAIKLLNKLDEVGFDFRPFLDILKTPQFKKEDAQILNELLGNWWEKNKDQEFRNKLRPVLNKLVMDVGLKKAKAIIWKVADKKLVDVLAPLRVGEYGALATEVLIDLLAEQFPVTSIVNLFKVEPVYALGFLNELFYQNEPAFLACFSGISAVTSNGKLVRPEGIRALGQAIEISAKCQIDYRRTGAVDHKACCQMSFVNAMDPEEKLRYWQAVKQDLLALGIKFYSKMFLAVFISCHELEEFNEVAQIFPVEHMETIRGIEQNFFKFIKHSTEQFPENIAISFLDKALRLAPRKGPWTFYASVLKYKLQANEANWISLCASIMDLRFAQLPLIEFAKSDLFQVLLSPESWSRKPNDNEAFFYWMKLVLGTNELFKIEEIKSVANLVTQRIQKAASASQIEQGYVAEVAEIIEFILEEIDKKRKPHFEVFSESLARPEIRDPVQTTLAILMYATDLRSHRVDPWIKEFEKQGSLNIDLQRSIAGTTEHKKMRRVKQNKNEVHLQGQLYTYNRILATIDLGRLNALKAMLKNDLKSNAVWHTAFVYLVQREDCYADAIDMIISELDSVNQPLHSGFTLLMICAQVNSLATTRKLLSKGADLNVTCTSKSMYLSSGVEKENAGYSLRELTAVHMAIRSGSNRFLEVTKVLRNLKSINYPSGTVFDLALDFLVYEHLSVTPECFVGGLAIVSGEKHFPKTRENVLEILPQLRHFYFQKELSDSYTAGPVQRASELGCTELLDYFAKIDFEMKRESRVGTMLHVLAKAGNWDAFKRQVKSEKDLGKRSPNGNLPIHEATAHTSFLQNYVREYSSSLPPKLGDLTGAGGLNLAQIACIKNHSETINWLLNQYPDFPFYVAGQARYSAMALACNTGNSVCAMFLMKRASEANENLGYMTVVGYKPGEGELGIKVRKALLHGLKANGHSMEGAIQGAKDKHLYWVLEFLQDLDVQKKEEKNEINRILTLSDEEASKAILKFPDQRRDIYIDSFGHRPLHIAASNGMEKTTRVLLSLGANSNVYTSDGRTPFNCAKSRGFIKVGGTLLTEMKNPDIERFMPSEIVADMELVAQNIRPVYDPSGRGYYYLFRQFKFSHENKEYYFNIALPHAKANGTPLPFFRVAGNKPLTKKTILEIALAGGGLINQQFKCDDPGFLFISHGKDLGLRLQPQQGVSESKFSFLGNSKPAHAQGKPDTVLVQEH